ncbi:MAG: YaeQ family protein [Gemmatimonadetes bacterium]|nr:YaeQ family protein [Gemmatimonadota bacterium]MDA1102497.1 YaeQ family protein [Gemmatimonadota bacterium]
MALPATVYNVEVSLSHMDRGVYEQLSIKAARHPSESEEYFLTRLLAYCLEYGAGITFSKGGISDPDDPPIMIKDLTGAWQSWIEIGAPDAARLHQASKASPRVALYTHKEPRILMRGYEGQRIHKAEDVEIYAVDRELLTALADRLDRRIAWALSVSDSQLFLDVGGVSLGGAIERLSLPG